MVSEILSHLPLEKGDESRPRLDPTLVKGVSRRISMKKAAPI
jgi:hypothetical protein